MEEAVTTGGVAAAGAGLQAGRGAGLHADRGLQAGRGAGLHALRRAGAAAMGEATGGATGGAPRSQEGAQRHGSPVSTGRTRLLGPAMYTLGGGTRGGT